MTQEMLFDGTTAKESAQARRQTARADRMAKRQRSTVRCSMCNGYHYREIDPVEWAQPCRLCGVAHGGYCSPAHGLTPNDWGST